MTNAQDAASLFKQCSQSSSVVFGSRSIFKSVLATLNRTTGKARKVEVLEQMFSLLAPNPVPCASSAQLCPHPEPGAEISMSRSAATERGSGSSGCSMCSGEGNHRCHLYSEFGVESQFPSSKADTVISCVELHHHSRVQKRR